MKTTMLTMALCALATHAAAQEATPDTFMTEAKSLRTRAEVRAEAMQQLRSPQEQLLLAEGWLPSVAHPRLRAEVVAELHAARLSGELASLSAEAHDFAPLQRTRAYAARRH
jgi:hypothetical protein